MKRHCVHVAPWRRIEQRLGTYTYRGGGGSSISRNEKLEMEMRKLGNEEMDEREKVAVSWPPNLSLSLLVSGYIAV